MAPRPRIRVAVAQLAYHPAARIEGRRSPREDPIFVADEPSSLRPPGVDLPAPLEDRLRGLERRIREVHDRQLELRLRAIVASCRRWGVDLLALPEYSVPAGLLRGLAEAAGEVMVVAGSHVVDDRESLLDTSAGGIYGDLGWRGDARAMHGCAVAPVLHRGRMVHLQAKLHSADPASERAEWARMRWEPVALPKGGGEFGVLFAEDVANHDSERWKLAIRPSIATCELNVILSYAALLGRRLGGFRVVRQALALGAPALLAVNERGDGAQIALSRGMRLKLHPGEEGLVVADLDLDTYDTTLVASPAFVYRTHPVGDEYATWSAAFAAHLEEATNDELGELLAASAEARNLLLGAGALIMDHHLAHRLRRLVDGDIPPSNLEELRSLTREILLPSECLPFDYLCGALARAAAQRLVAWKREAHNREEVDAWLACVGHLEERIGRLPKGLVRAIEVPTADLWSDAGREALADVDAALHVDADTEANRAGAAPSSLAPETIAEAPPEAAEISTEAPIRGPRNLPTPAPTDADLDAWLADYRGLAKVWRERRMALLRDTDELFEPPLALTPGADDPRPALGLLDAWAGADAPIGLLLGDAGVGKSTLLIEWAARRWPRGRRPLPLIARLDWSRRADDPLAMLLEVAELADTPTARLRLRHLIDRGVLLPCFDGFDEALARLPADAHRRLLEGLLVLVDGGGRLLIASGSDVFAERAPACALVDAAARPRADAATRIHLQPFSDRQVAGLIRKLAGDSADGAAIIERLTSHYDLEHLARRPLLLAMVLRTLGSLDPTTWVTAADLYEAYLDRWQTDADALPEQPLDADARALVLEALALTIWDRAASACTAADLRRAFLRDLAPELAERGDAALSAALAVGLPAGFVAGDPEAGLRFTHASYVEFFVARALVRHLGRCRERLLGVRALNPAIVEFVDQLLRRRGGDALAGHWQQALGEWVTSRERVERTASTWLGNAQRVLDGLAARRGEEQTQHMAQGTGALAPGDHGLVSALGDARAARAPSPEPAAPEPAKPTHPRSELAQPGGAARSIDALDGDAIDIDEDSDDEAERDEAPRSRAMARGDRIARIAPRAAPEPYAALAEEAEEAEAAAPHAQAQEAAWTVLDDDDDDPPSRGPPPSEPQRRRAAPPSAPPAPSLATPPPHRQAHADGGLEPTAKKRLLLSKANLTAKAAPAIRARNRFLPGRPLDDPNLPGREDILREFSTLLDQASPALLKGPRRAGKSSILRAIEGRERPHRKVIRRDLERAALLREPGELARLLFPGLRDDPEPAEALWRQLEDARDAGEPPPALLLDELAYLREGSDALFAWLRALGQEGLAGLVLAGSHADWIDVIRQANQTPGSSFGNDYTVIELGPLSDAEAIRFLVVTAPDDVAIDPTRTAKWIVDLCGGWPFYLQVMGYAVVEEVRSGRHAALVRPDALRDLYERRLLRERGPAVFGSRWGDLRRPAQELLLAELDRARDRRTRHLTPYKELPRHARAILSDADLIDAVSGWKIDRPFADWLHRNLDELEPSHG